VVTAALIVLIENGLTLMHMPRLLTNPEFREQCLERVTDSSIVEFFHDRYDQWGREPLLLRESTLNKIGAFSLNPRLKLMLGQKANHLDFRAIMDQGKILLLDLGHSDGETNRLIGSLVVTGLELAMRRRRNHKLWNLTIDEFAGYVANEGSVKTLAHVFSEGRKFRMSMTVAHQDLSQLTPRMLGALSNVQTKVIFGIGRHDAEYFAKLIGRVDAEAVKRDPKTENQHELFSPLSEQWEQWVDRLRFQPARQATVASQDGRGVSLRTQHRLVLRLRLIRRYRKRATWRSSRTPNALRMLAVVGQVGAEPLVGRALWAPGKGERPRQVRLAHPVQDLHQRRAYRVQVGPHRLPRLVATGLVVSPVPGLNVLDVPDSGRLAGSHVAQPLHAHPLPVGNVGQDVFGPTYPN